MQKVGGQGAAWHCGKKESGGTPAAIFDKFVRSKDVAGRGQRGGGNGGRWSAQQRISISFISIILIKLKKYIQGGGGGKQQNNNQAGRKKAGEKKEKQKQARQIKKERKDGKSVNGKRKNVRHVMKAPQKPGCKAQWNSRDNGSELDGKRVISKE